MLKLFLTATSIGALTACMPDMPTDLLAPLNPAIATRAAPPRGTPTRGLKPFKPAEAQDWLGTERPAVSPNTQDSPNAMKSMLGMGGMK